MRKHGQVNYAEVLGICTQKYPKVSNIKKLCREGQRLNSLEKYGKVSKSMHKYVQVFKSMQKYAKVCNILVSIKSIILLLQNNIYRSIQKHEKSMQNYARAWISLIKYTKVYTSMQNYPRVSQIPKLFK